jgi:hypothetical protein
MSGAELVSLSEGVAVNPVQEPVGLQHAINLVAARANEIRAQVTNLPSPCISVCRMSPASG